jgi:hypothetical protein
MSGALRKNKSKVKTKRKMLEDETKGTVYQAGLKVLVTTVVRRWRHPAGY